MEMAPWRSGSTACSRNWRWWKCKSWKPEIIILKFNMLNIECEAIQHLKFIISLRQTGST